MSTGDVPPTEPLIPREPRGPVVREPVVGDPVVGRETVVADGFDPAWIPRLADQIRSLKGYLALLTVIALAALGLSIYDLVKVNDNNNNNNGGASQQRVANLSDRVSRLEGKSTTAADAASISRLNSRVSGKAGKQELQALSDQVRQLRTAVDKAGSGNDSAVTQLSSRVDDLAQQVNDLQSQSSGATTP